MTDSDVARLSEANRINTYSGGVERPSAAVQPPSTSMKAPVT